MSDSDLAPIIYLAFRSKQLRGRIPPELVDRIITRRCSRCRVKVVLDPVADRHTLDLGQRSGRRVNITCDRCCRRMEPDLVAVPPADPVIAQALTRHEAVIRCQ